MILFFIFRMKTYVLCQIKMILIRLLLIIEFINATFLYFEQQSYEILLPESTEIATKITRIQAISSSPRLSIDYILHGDINQTFALHSTTGELILLKSLDYETIPIYKLTIEGRSSSMTPCFSELIISILDINDHPPEINLILHPSILYQSNLIRYDLNTSSTSFATITIKDLDHSTDKLTLTINDTEHFQIQLIRQTKTLLLYLLSTKNNPQFLANDHISLALNSCDHDFCTQQTYRFHFKSTEYLCHLSFDQQMYILDIQEDLPKQTLLMHKITNQFCTNSFYSIDDREYFSIDSSTGDLFTEKHFNRTERSIYSIHLAINNQWHIQILIRILDQHGNIPFLLKKYLAINSNRFFYLHLFNSTTTSCRAQGILENYFQLFSNCTIVPLIKPPKGRYLFHIELNHRENYHDTFLLELEADEEEEEHRQPSWIIIIAILLGIFFVLGAIITTIILIKQNRSQFFSKNQRASSLSTNDDDHHYHTFSTHSKLQVHDDPFSPKSTAIYLVGKPSPALSSSTPARDDEGYSGSSDVSDNHQITILSANQLLEQYRIHDFHSTSLYDVPRRSSDVSLV